MTKCLSGLHLDDGESDVRVQRKSVLLEYRIIEKEPSRFRCGMTRRRRATPTLAFAGCRENSVRTPTALSFARPLCYSHVWSMPGAPPTSARTTV